MAWPGAKFTISCTVTVTEISVTSSEDLVRFNISHRLEFNEMDQVECVLYLHSAQQTWKTEAVVLRKECPPSRRYWNKQGMCVSCPILHDLVEVDSLNMLYELQSNEEDRCKLNILNVFMVVLACLVPIILLVMLAFKCNLVDRIRKHLPNGYHPAKDEEPLSPDKADVDPKTELLNKTGVTDTDL